ncbi:SLBB domain-containing protein [candidate division KSB1 bacterium]|nr:SLBB domain-containing protein [candidate division KSB1 bacterium]
MRHLLVLLLCIALPAYVQDLSSLSSLRDLRDASKKASLQLPESPEIEHPVDENVYRVGPGDVFNIVIGGDQEESQMIMISPEGHAVLPGLESVMVAGEILARAKSILTEKLRSVYYSEQISITLVQLRTFRVTVSGAVNFPGLVSVNGLARVSDAIFMAGGLVVKPPPFPLPENPNDRLRILPNKDTDVELTPEEYEELEEKVASKRSIFVRRRDKSVLHADLLKFELAGDLDANPYLVDGDVIVVPTVQKEVGEVSISGAVRTPGAFEHVHGDDIRCLLDMAHGFSIDADSARIFIARFIDNSSRTQEIVLEIDWSNAEQVGQILATPLRADDRVFIRRMPNFHKKRTIEIQGEVRYPGEYALLKDPTHLAEMIDIAGGFTDQAALNAAYIVRRPFEDRQDADFDRLAFMTVQEMERKEKAYFRERSREMKGLVSTDFLALFEKGEEKYDVMLCDQDLIVVPAKDYAVNVIGHVKNPGLIPYVPNMDASYYIKLAGGYNVGAWKSKVRVKKAGTGEMLSKSNTIVEMGDTVYVPERLETEDLLRDIALITVQLATVVMLVVQTSWYATRN